MNILASDEQLEANFVISTSDLEDIMHIRRYCMSPLINLTELATLHYTMLNNGVEPKRLRTSNRSELANKLNLNRHFQPGEVENLKKLIKTISVELSTVDLENNVVGQSSENVPTLPTKRKGEDTPTDSLGTDFSYLISLSPNDHEIAMKLLMEENKKGDPILIPFFVNTPVPYIVDLNWYQAGTRSKYVTETKKNVSILWRVLKTLEVPNDKAVSNYPKVSAGVRKSLLELARTKYKIGGSDEVKSIVRLLQDVVW